MCRLKNLSAVAVLSLCVAGTSSAAEETVAGGFAVERLGTIAVGIVETNPILWKGEPYLYEFNRWSNGRIRPLTGDMNRFVTTCAPGLKMSCAYAEGDHVAVMGTRDFKGGRTSGVFLTESDDFKTWTEPRCIYTNVCTVAYNSTMCKADGRYVLAVEYRNVKEEKPTNPGYQMAFLESKDLKTWTRIPDTAFVNNAGSPCLKYHDGWFYFYHLYIQRWTAEKKPFYVMRVARSRDLKNWTIGKRDVLVPEPAVDRRPHPGIKFTEKDLAKMSVAENRNNSDIDMKEYKGDLLICYSWGDQLGKEFLALGIVKGVTERAFSESFFAE